MIGSAIVVRPTPRTLRYEKRVMRASIDAATKVNADAQRFLAAQAMKQQLKERDLNERKAVVVSQQECEIAAPSRECLLLMKLHELVSAHRAQKHDSIAMRVKLRQHK